MVPERGGHRQKRNRNQSDTTITAPDPSVKSPLATGLICRWAEGQLSAVDVQELASLAVQSGASDAEVVWLAGIGAHGQNTSHCSRALYAKYCKDMCLPERYLIKVPLREMGNKNASLEVGISILLPHDWMDRLSKSGSFDEFMGIPFIENWWAGSNNKNQVFSTPLLGQRLQAFRAALFAAW